MVRRHRVPLARDLGERHRLRRVAARRDHHAERSCRDEVGGCGADPRRQQAVEWRGRPVTVGPSEAFALFFKNNSDPVFRTLLAGTLNRAAAEDATAEAFARAFAHWDMVAIHPNPKAWLLRVAWNCYGSSWRKWESRWTADPPELTPPTPEPWSDPDLIAAIRALPQSQREVIVLVALGELTPTQAARVLGKPAGTVRRLLFQARVALHQALDEATAPEEEDD
jgi:RNA polymerase sigma-70 factor (ECF subfamily)